MKISIDNFQGMAPRFSPRALPPSMSQDAVNARLLSGDLQAWQDWLSVFTLTKSGPINTIYLMEGTNGGEPVWLSWNDGELGDGAVCVDVARGPIPADTNERTYLTGLDLPRFTTLTAAIDGSGTDYPYVTYLLGVPAVDGAPIAELVFSDDSQSGQSLNFEDTGSNLSLYTTSTNVGSGSGADRFVGAATTLDGTKPASWYGLQSRLSNRNAYMAWAMGVESITTVLWEADFQLVTAFGEDARLELRLLNSSTGTGPAIRIDGKTDKVYVGVGNTFGTDVDTSSVSFPGALTMGTTYRFRIDVSTVANNVVNCQFRLAAAATPTAYFVDQTFQITPVGSYFAFGTSETSTGGSRAFIAAYNNLTVSAAVSTGGDGSGAGTDTATTAATNYVQTWVNDFGEEGPPSSVSNTVVRSAGTVVQVYLITSADTGFPSEYNIVSTRLYRAVTGSTGTSYQLVAADLPVDYPTYTDTLTDAELGEVLLSDTWDLPPDDLRGIIALPNGIMAGFSKNQLCLSEPYRPHAWPVGYRLSVDTDIVAIGAIDANVVIFTNAYPYIASGTAPADYTLSKLELPQGCVSKRSVSYLRKVGVLYASPDGLCAVSAVGDIINLTERLFAREEWQQLNPSSIIASVHDDRYVGFYDTTEDEGSDGVQQGFMLDLHTDGFGFEYLDVFATAVYANPATDTFYMTNFGVNLGPVAAFSGSPTSGEPPLTVVFDDQSTNQPTSWLWDFGDSSGSTEQNPTHEYPSAGTYTVSLYVENIYGSDVEIKTDYITVSNPPVTTTWNPADKTADFTLSNGNLTVTDSGTTSYNNIRATVSKSSGKYYWEHQWQGSDTGDDWIAGIRTAAASIATNWFSASNPGVRSDGNSIAGTSGATLHYNLDSNFDVGDYLSCAVDLDTGEMWFARNGNWNGGDPAAGTNPMISNIPSTTWFPYAGTDNSVLPTVTFTTNFGNTPYQYAAPSGFGNWE